MQNNIALQLLPRQRNGVITKPANSKSVEFYSNIFEIKLKQDCLVIYQYSFDFSPQLPPDSDGLIRSITKAIWPDLKKNIGLITYRGAMAWGRTQMKTVLSLKAEFEKNDEKHSYEILVKPVKHLGLEAFVGQNIENLAVVSQVLNISTKEALRKLQMVELTPGSYYDPKTINDNKASGGLNVMRGFDITVTVFNKKLFLQVDPCSRIIRQESFLDTLHFERKNISMEGIIIKYKGSPVIRKYGSPKIYKIEDIDYKLTPKGLFYDSKQAREMTYIEYYQIRYGVKIKDGNQPLLKVLADRKFNKNKAVKEYIYLVPELVSLTGLTDEQRKDFRVMKSLGEFTKMTANKRMEETGFMIEDIKEDKDIMFDIRNSPTALNGFKLSTPRIMLGNNRDAVVTRDGSIKLKERVYDPYEFKDFVFCYSVGKEPDYDREDCDEALDILKTAAKTFGIKLGDPIFVEINNGRNLNDWISALDKEKKKMEKDEKNDIFFFFLKPQEEKFYGELKKFITLEFNCPSQVTRRKLLSKGSKGALSAASKIVMQMNVKNGHSLWIVKNSHAVWRNNTVAIAGMANSKGKKGSNVAFVGSTTQDLSQYFSDCKAISKKEDNSKALYQEIFTQWLQTWYKMNNKKLPNVLVFYRQGLNAVQARIQLEVEIEGLQNTIEKVRAKAKQPEYKPTIIYMMVNKKPNSRMFEGQKRGKNLSFENPEPGSIIFEDLSEGYKEFHLASAFVREGTCTPVSFKVAYENDPKFSFEAITELTYNQTYCYYNWTGSVRVPATLQNANKLAKLYSQIGDDLKTESKNSDIKNKLFYL